MYGAVDESFHDVEIRRIQQDVDLTSDLYGSIGDNKYRFLGISFAAEVECFKGSNLKRTVTAIFAASGQQLIGATFVTGYATYFFDLINVQNFFLVSCILYLVMILATCAVFPLVEVVGRRTLIVPSLFILCVLLLLIGIMGCIPNQVTAGWVIIVMIYIWAIVYQLSIGATGFILASEVATMRLRAVTQVLVTVTNGVWGLIMQFTIPYMINTDAGNLGGKTGFIFFATGCITGVVGYFLFPETKVDPNRCELSNMADKSPQGIPFEKLDELYHNGVSPRQFKTMAREQIERGVKSEASGLPSNLEKTCSCEAIEVV